MKKRKNTNRKWWYCAENCTSAVLNRKLSFGVTHPREK